MKQIALLLLLGSILSVSCKPKKSDPQKEIVSEQPTGDKEWISLFNGKDLQGWDIKIAGYPLNENFGNTFRVSDGILKIRYDAYGEDFKDRFGAIYFKEAVSDFRLKVTYRFVGETAPGAPEWGYRDSGVQFLGQAAASMELNQKFPISLEYNLHGGNGKDERPVGAICANGMFIEIDGERNSSYCTPASKARTFHGDQWVTLEIDVKDGNIEHFVNGEKILSYSNPVYDVSHEIASLYIKEQDSSVTSGYISLQSNSHPVDFRAIELKEYH